MIKVVNKDKGIGRNQRVTLYCNRVCKTNKDHFCPIINKTSCKSFVCRDNGVMPCERVWVANYIPYHHPTAKGWDDPPRPNVVNVIS